MRIDCETAAGRGPVQAAAKSRATAQLKREVELQHKPNAPRTHGHGSWCVLLESSLLGVRVKPDHEPRGRPQCLVGSRTAERSMEALGIDAPGGEGSLRSEIGRSGRESIGEAPSRPRLGSFDASRCRAWSEG